MSTFRRFVSFLLLAVFTFISVPKELIHELHHHDDTTHHSCSTYEGDINLEEQHIHCEYLKIEVQPFNSTSQILLSDFIFSFSEFIESENQFFQLQKKENHNLRGPPFIA